MRVVQGSEILDQAMSHPTITFDEIVSGASARLAVIDHVNYLCAKDVIMFICGKNNKQASQIWSRLSLEQLDELSSFRRNFQFPGQGQSEQPVLDFKGILKLIMMVGGENAKKYRSAMVSILQRYYAGDGLLLDEVEANAQSAGPIQQMARESLAAELTGEDEKEGFTWPFKKRRMELEMARMEVEVEARRIANRTAELSNTAMEREHFMKVTESYKELCLDTVIDERARLILKDNFLNMAMLNGLSTAGGAGGGQRMLTNGKPTSLSLVADKLKMSLSTGELISLGQELKRRYVEKHGKSPPKHSQLCGGRATLVNTYMEADEPLIEEVLRAHVAGRF